MKRRALAVSIMAAVLLAVVVWRIVPRRATDVILLQAQCNGKPRVFTVNLDGSGFRPFIWNDEWTTVSPDGKYYSIQTYPDLEVRCIDGRRVLRVRGDAVSDPVYSHDRRTMAIGVYAYGYPSKFVVADADGRNQRVFWVKRGGGIDLSPDGKRIAYSVGENMEPRDVYISDTYGRKRRFLAHGDSPEFSPDGETVAFAREGEDGKCSIYLVDADGKHERRLLTHKGRAFDPVFSRDGRMLIFRADVGNGDIGLYTVGSNGKNRRMISSGPIWDAVFSPDGSRIA